MQKHLLNIILFAWAATATIALFFRTHLSTGWIASSDERASHEKRFLQSIGRGFIVITDIHTDPLYVGSSRFDDVNVCREQHPDDAHGYAQNESISLRYINDNYNFGRAHCDPPIRSVRHLLSKIPNVLHKKHPDFVVVNGDLAAHLLPHQHNLFDAINVTAHILRDSFANIPVIPLVGNTDMLVANFLNVCINGVYDLSCSPQLEPLAKLYYTLGWLNAEQYESFCAFGYYSIHLHHDITLLILNTLPYSPLFMHSVHEHPVPCSQREHDILFWHDPLGQFAWLRQQLHRARRHNRFVFIAGHAPPGRKDGDASWCDIHAEQYGKIIRMYHDIISAQLYGDHSVDELRLVYGSPAFINPGISPRKNSVPAFRFYSIGSSGHVLDYGQWLAPLSLMGAEPNWQYHYSFADRYKTVGPITGASFRVLFEQFKHQPALMHKYQRAIWSHVSNERDDIELLCDFLHIDEASNHLCKKTGALNLPDELEF